MPQMGATIRGAVLQSGPVYGCILTHRDIYRDADCMEMQIAVNHAQCVCSHARSWWPILLHVFHAAALSSFSPPPPPPPKDDRTIRSQPPLFAHRRTEITKVHLRLRKHWFPRLTLPDIQGKGNPECPPRRTRNHAKPPTPTAPGSATGGVEKRNTAIHHRDWRRSHADHPRRRSIVPPRLGANHPRQTCEPPLRFIDGRAHARIHHDSHRPSHLIFRNAQWLRAGRSIAWFRDS
ncbi:hypothetical protein P152DRAFT_187741 [Eremomyces bilateralis CBS 781.70]|uniref:Uncharacterized protein n=1 Tax=Eremomyces bilateralis CBS 781.70 TaxID=1392243 RepID=A0A6G1GCE1_9PEZI|nr:uncharacterized protein P152DRAFT_187741 [Eremomyces bilateralis CBS 781.70]KAF1815519.1 hypothetical protein P152DRAFT_187741 [Eremomyces bilateralis CBS 781.70]